MSIVHQLRRPFILRRNGRERRYVATEQRGNIAFLLCDDGSAMGYFFMMAMLRSGEAFFDV